MTTGCSHGLPPSGYPSLSAGSDARSMRSLLSRSTVVSRVPIPVVHGGTEPAIFHRDERGGARLGRARSPARWFGRHTMASGGVDWRMRPRMRRRSRWDAGSLANLRTRRRCGVPRRVVAGRRVGDLESEILEQLWAARAWLSGREVWERLGGLDRAYTTVMTVLGRLVEKGLVERVDGGRGHLYRAAGDPDELTAQAIRSLLSATADPAAALALVVEERAHPGGAAEVAALVERVRAK